MCETCGGSTIAGARGRKPRFCSTRCRVSAHRRAQKMQPIPRELRCRDRWIRHLNKRPLSVDGHWIGVTDDSKWRTFEEALSSECGDGVGFVLNGDGVVCIDIDDCVSNGRVSRDALALLALLPKTYVEFSPSGRGLHVWGLADLDAGRVLSWRDLKLEVYPNGRYLTMTGNRWGVSTGQSVGRLASLDLSGILAG